jgi:hypothetical protein
MSNKNNLENQIYSEVSSFGLIWSLLSAIIATIFGLLLISGGVYFLFKKQDKYDAIQGIVNSTPNPSCVNDCSILVSYNYKGVNYNTILNYDFSDINNLQKGDNIIIYVKNEIPTSIHLKKGLTVSKGISVFSIIFGFLILGLGWFWYYASKKSKFISAVEGSRGILDIVTGGKL